MTGTIKCEASENVSTNHLSKGYLRSIGMLTPDGLAKLSDIKLEFINIPEAISRIVEFAESEYGKPPIFTIGAITDHGIVLEYIIEVDGKTKEDCYYFVPMHNVACLHTMDSTLASATVQC